MPTYTSYTGELATKLQDFRSRGQKEASKHRPSPDAAAPDQHETALRSDAEGWLSSEQRLFDTTLTEIARGVTEARQKAIELQGQVHQLLGDDSATSSVEAELAGDRPALARSTENRFRAEAALKYFRATNEINEEANYPASTLWHLGLLMLFAFLETIVNTFFYENSQGLLGGFFVALTIAALNIGSAVFLGICFRLKNLALVEKKVFGWSALAVFVLTAVFFNSLFASFRSEYQLVVDPSEVVQLSAAFQRAWPQALLVFHADPQFKDHWSFLLFGIGLLLSIAAFWKGYTLDDQYPGHGRMDKAYKKAATDEQAQQDKVRQKVKELLHHRKAAVQAAIHEPSTQVGMLARRIADLTHARGSLDSQAAAIQRDYSLVTEAYRNANTSVRSVPPPAYFKEPTTLSARADGSGAERVLTDLSAVQEELKTLGETNREPLNAKLRALQGDTSEILSKMLTDYLGSVRKDAEETIARTTPTIHRVQAA